MKRFLGRTLLFSIFTLPLYMALVIVWGHFMPYQFLKKNVNYKLGSKGHMYSRMQDLKHTKDLDVLFMGSSHAYRGFDTRAYEEQGIKVFNLGSSSQTPLQSKILLDRHLDQLDPNLVIFEVYPGTFENDGVESSLDLIANTDYSSRLLEMAFTINHIKTYNTFIYGFFRELAGLNENFVEDPVKREDLYIEGGYVEKKLSYFDSTESFIRKQQWTFKDYQVEAFESILEDLNRRNIRYLLLFAPINSDLYATYTNNAEVDTMFSRYGDYFNFNGVLELDNHKDFYDSHHLNQNGVKKFNIAIIDLFLIQK